MSKFSSTAAQDACLNVYKTCTHMTFCSAQPANYAGIAAVALATSTTTSTPSSTQLSFTGPATGTPNGRTVTVGAVSSVPVTGTGNVLFVALDDGTTLHYVDTIPSQAVTSGGTMSATAWPINLSDPA